MNHRILLGLLLTAAGMSAQSPSAARDSSVHEVIPRYRYRVIGVYDDRSGEPIEDVDVIDVLSGNSVKTTSTGTASLLFLPDGGGLVRLRKLGYAISTTMVRISPADTNPVTMVLARATELPAVATVDSAPHYISIGLKGFQERMNGSHMGTYLDEKLLLKETGRLLGTVLNAHLPALGQYLKYSGANRVLLSGKCAVYLNGLYLKGQNDLSDFQVESLAAIEYYKSSAAPVQYPGVGECGVVLLWTRER